MFGKHSRERLEGSPNLHPKGSLVHPVNKKGLLKGSLNSLLT